jgi:hypothetical protein
MENTKEDRRGRRKAGDWRRYKGEGKRETGDRDGRR